MKETELAEKFITFFGSPYKIYKEVPAGGGIIDFVAKDGAITIAVEVKTNLNFKVIEQAYMNKHYCTYSYIAVPRTKGYHFGHQICRDYGIGVLSYTGQDKYMEGVHEEVRPKMNRHKIRLKLCDYMKQSVAGSQNDRVTPFKNTINNIVKYIRRHPECTLKNCLESIDFHWSNMASAKGSVYQWIQRGVITEFRLDKGKLYLNEQPSAVL